ncbi:MAG: STAS domain-containing protein [Anaerolineales bacterium]|jgi:anti-sigma B factor antagonist|nr:STAS domain-containing protein [Anaerolineales bacterium]
MEINIQMMDGISIVSATGSLDALTSEALVVKLSELIEHGRINQVLDLSQVEFMSSAGLRAILVTLKQCRSQGGDLRLSGAKPGVTKVLNLSGFTSITKTYPALPEALASFS